MPLAYIRIAVVVIHGAFSLLVVGIPHAFVTVVVHEVESTLAVLLVVEPFAHVLLAIVEKVGTLTLTLAFYILSFVNIAATESGLAFSVRTLAFQLAHIFGPVLESMITNLDLCRSSGSYKE